MFAPSLFCNFRASNFPTFRFPNRVILTTLLLTLFTYQTHSILLPIRLPVGAAGPAAASIGTRVIFAGGQTPGLPYNSGVLCFDARDPNVTLNCPALATSRQWTANSVAGNEFFVMGGWTGTVASTQVDVYNLSATPISKTTTSINSPGRYTQIYGTNGGSWNTLAIFFGGVDINGNNVNDIARIRRTGTTFALSSGATYAPFRAEGSSVSFISEGHVMTVFSGGQTTAANSVTNDINFFNHTLGFSSNLARKMSITRIFHASVITSDNNFLVLVGGATGTVTAGTRTIDVFNIPNMTLNRTLSLAVARRSVAAAVLGPYIYVAGGASDATTNTNLVEIIDTRNWTVFTFPERLPSARRFMSGTSVPRVGVFFGGGFTAGAGTYFADIFMFTCGNGIRESYEACDLIPGCLRDCTGCDVGFVPCNLTDCCSITPTPTPTPTPIPTPIIPCGTLCFCTSRTLRSKTLTDCCSITPTPTSTPPPIPTPIIPCAGSLPPSLFECVAGMWINRDPIVNVTFPIYLAQPTSRVKIEGDLIIASNFTFDGTTNLTLLSGSLFIYTFDPLNPTPDVGIIVSGCVTLSGKFIFDLRNRTVPKTGLNISLLEYRCFSGSFSSIEIANGLEVPCDQKRLRAEVDYSQSRMMLILDYVHDTCDEASIPQNIFTLFATISLLGLIRLY